MYSHFIFDYDGTLVDSLSIYLTGFEKVFKEFGVNTSQYEIAEKCFGTIDGAKNLGIADTKTFYKKVDDLIEPQIKHPPLFKNVEETLKKLKDNNKKLSIVSSSSKKSIEEDLKLKNIFNLFDLIISGDDVEELKPNPQGIFKVIQYYNLPTDNFLMVGDSRKDLVAAKNANIANCLFFPKESFLYYKKQDLVEKYKPNLVIEYFLELLNY